jgi:DNA-binding LacI/PurR family transcriptional regulator
MAFPMKVSVKQIAEKAGISKVSAYQILANPEHPRYSQKTRDKVLAVSRKLGYVPNALARSMRTGKTQTLGLMVTAYGQKLGQPDAFFSDILPAICLTASLQGYHVLVKLDHQRQFDLPAYRQMLTSRRVDGMILTDPVHEDPRLELIAQAKTPAIIIGRPVPEDLVDSIDNDNVHVAAMATEHLIQLGHRNIAHLTGHQNFTVFEDRSQGFRQAMSQAGLSTEHYLEIGDGFDSQHMSEIVDQILAHKPRPTAVLADDDMLAATCIAELFKRGIMVPAKLSVISINHSSVARQHHPPLTAVDLQLASLGQLVTEMLIDRIEHPRKAIQRRLIPVMLTQGQSVAAVSK